jgi:hypothetical protein
MSLFESIFFPESEIILSLWNWISESTDPPVTTNSFEKSYIDFELRVLRRKNLLVVFFFSTLELSVGDAGAIMNCKAKNIKIKVKLIAQ